MRRYSRFRHNIAVLAAVIGALAAQTRERKMQPIFYQSSPNEPTAPAHPPVAIHGGTAAPVPAAPSASPAGSVRAFVNAQRNSRVVFGAHAPFSRAAWQMTLPPQFAAETVLAAGGHVIVYGPDGWLLLDRSGSALGRDRAGEGDLTLDPPRAVFYAAGVNGYLDAFEVARVRSFEQGLLTLLRSKHADLLDSIRKSGDLSSADEAKLKGIVDDYAKTFS